jgi:hypothetical protein
MFVAPLGIRTTSLYPANGEHMAHTLIKSKQKRLLATGNNNTVSFYIWRRPEQIKES